MPPEDDGEGGDGDGAAEPADEGAIEATTSENGDLPVEELVEAAAVEDEPAEEAPVATADEVVDDGVAEIEAAQENEEMDAGEAPPADDGEAPPADDGDAPPEEAEES